MTLNSKKICFITCVNNKLMFEECKLYINRLHIPEGYEIDVLSIEEASSMAAGYNEGMNASDAKYKVYLHQDTYLVDRYFLHEMLDIFKSDDDIGMIGSVGTVKLSSDGCMWNSDRIWCSYCPEVSNISGCDEYYRPGTYETENVSAVDGHLIITQYDIPWRDDIFHDFDFYDASQSMEFTKAGYNIVVPRFDKPLCVHDDGMILDLINYDTNRRIFLNEYKDMIPTASDMLSHYIEKLSPVPKLNLSYYADDDVYSEGDIENEVVGLIANNEPEDYTDAIFDNFSWSSFYHLTPIRRNILNWYPFDPDSDILEIGCGLGAITGMLCDIAKSVTCVELSKRRATGALLRCRHKTNLEIIVGNLNDIRFEKKFDYITLIGVLEYQGTCTDSDDPYTDFLKKIRSLLKPGGKLLIAIENRFGLKYWVGAHEDHTGVPFDGINDYSLSKSAIRTFSHRDLKELVKASGFKHSYFYYPMPDYKLPKVIYSQDQTPEDGNMHNMRPYYIPDAKSVIANEAALWHDIVKNGSFSFFANSFLVECSDTPVNEHVTFAVMNTERQKKYGVGTRTLSGGKVEKFDLYTGSGLSHLDTIIKNEEKLLANGVCVLPGKRGDRSISYDFINAPSLDSMVVDMIINNDASGIEDIFDRIYKDILKASSVVPAENNAILKLDKDAPTDPDLYGPILENAFIDMILRNAFMTDNKITWIDQEWTLENMPANYVMFRLLKEFGLSHRRLNDDLRFIYEKFGVLSMFDVYNRFERSFLQTVLDEKLLAEYNAFVPE